jgi:hypothetical protein
MDGRVRLRLVSTVARRYEAGGAVPNCAEQ